MAEQIVKTLIGRRDVANLPDFGLEGVAVKVFIVTILNKLPG